MASLLESIKRKSQIVVTQINTLIDAINGKLDKSGGKIEGDLTVTGKINVISTTINGTADTATKLSSAKIISLSGDATGSTTFDGSEDASIIVTVADNSHNHTVENIDNLQTTLNDKAPLASPEFTGTPTAPTVSSTTNNTQIATTAFVQSVVDSKIAAADAMIYKGTIGSGGTVTTLPSTHKTGWTYKVITAGTYAGMKCNVGDMIICLTDGTTSDNTHWTVVEGNIDGAVTGPTSSVNGRIAVFNGATGKVIKDSGFTIAKSVPSDAKFTDTTYTVGTTSYSGTTKLYTGTGSNTDGTITQSVLTTLLSDKLDATANAVSATSDANGNNIASTYAKKTELNAKAPLDSPILTGTPKAPTASAGTNNTQIATTAFVTTAVDKAVKLSGNQTITGTKTFSSTISGSISGNAATATKAERDASGNVITSTYATKTELNAKAPLDSPSLTGFPTAPTASSSTNTTQIATTAFVTTAINNKATSDASTYVTKNELKENIDEVVKLSGDQTIKDTKTFENVVVNDHLTIPGGKIWIE